MKASKKNIAVVAGLGVVLALSPVVGPVSTALAEETGGQTLEQVNEESNEASEYGLWAGDESTTEVDSETYKKPSHPSRPDHVNKWTVSFYGTDGSTLIDTVTLSTESDGIVFSEFLNALVKAHPEYADVEWTLVPDTTGAAITPDSVVGRSLNVYAKYEPATLISVTFYGTDGYGSTPIDTVTLSTESDGIVFSEFLNAFVAEHPEYADVEWTLVPDTTGAAITPDSVVDRSLNVYAKYDPATLISVSFYGTDGSTLIDTVTLSTESDGIVFSEFLNAFVAEHPEYADVEWTLVPDTTGAAITSDSVVGYNLKVFAKYEPVTTLSVTFRGTDGSDIDTVTLSTESDGIVFSEFLNAFVAEHPEYADVEWTLVPDTTGAAVTPDSVVGYDLNVYAKYEPVTTLSVTFVDYEGNVVDTVTLSTESDGIVFSEFLNALIAEHPEYADVEWTLVPDPTGAAVTPDSVVGYDLTVHALSSIDADDPATLYTVNFHDEDGELVRGVTRGGAWTLQSYIDDAYLSGLERDGYTLHWVTSLSDPDGSEVLPTDTVLANLDLYAYYTEDEAEDPETETYDVTFWDGLESTEDQVITVNAGGTVDPADVAEPTCEGYTFLGWYADTDLTVEFDFTAPIYADTTVYAKWEKDADAELPSDEEQPTTPSDPGEAAGTEDQKGDRKDVPETGDATVAVAGIGALGSALAGVGAFLKRRRS